MMDNLEKAECEFNDPHDVTPMYLEHFKDVTDRLRDPKIAERVSDELNKAISGEFTYRFPITEGITLFCKELSQKEIKNLQTYFTICNTTVKGDKIAMQLEFHDMVIQMTDDIPKPDNLSEYAKNVYRDTEDDRIDDITGVSNLLAKYIPDEHSTRWFTNERLAVYVKSISPRSIMGLQNDFQIRHVGIHEGELEIGLLYQSGKDDDD